MRSPLMIAPMSHPCCFFEPAPCCACIPASVASGCTPDHHRAKGGPTRSRSPGVVLGSWMALCQASLPSPPHGTERAGLPMRDPSLDPRPGRADRRHTSRGDHGHPRTGPVHPHARTLTRTQQRPDADGPDAPPRLFSCVCARADMCAVLGIVLVRARAPDKTPRAAHLLYTYTFPFPCRSRSCVPSPYFPPHSDSPRVFTVSIPTSMTVPVSASPRPNSDDARGEGPCADPYTCRWYHRPVTQTPSVLRPTHDGLPPNLPAPCARTGLRVSPVTRMFMRCCHLSPETSNIHVRIVTRPVHQWPMFSGLTSLAPSHMTGTFPAHMRQGDAFNSIEFNQPMSVIRYNERRRI